MSTKQVLILVAATVGLGLLVVIPVIAYHEYNKPEAVERRRIKLEQEKIEQEKVAETIRQEQIRKEKEETERLEEEARRVQAEARIKAKKQEEEARKKVEDEIDKKYRGIAKEFANSSLTLSNLFFEGTSLDQWREETKKIRLFSAKLADPRTDNNKLFYQQVVIIMDNLNNIESLWWENIKFEVRNNFPDVEKVKEMAKLATSSKELSKKLLTSIEQYKD